MKVLYLARWFPCPQDNGIKIRIWNILGLLQQAQIEVDFFCLTNQPIADQQLLEVKERVNSVTLGPFRDYRPGSLKAIAGFLSSSPRNLYYSFDPEAEKQITKMQQDNHYDVVIHSELDMILYGRNGREGTRHVLEDLEIASYFDQSRNLPIHKKMLSAFRRWKLIRFLKNQMQRYHFASVVSKKEWDFIHLYIEQKIVIFQNGVNTNTPLQDEATKVAGRLIYPGSITYSANFEAVQFIIEKVLPKIRMKFPAAHLIVTGRIDNTAASTLERDAVVFTGYVDDIQSEITSAMLTLVPIISGSGTRLKILESILYGTPVISTTKGAEGLDRLESGRDISIADTEEDFINSVADLISQS